MDGFAKGGAEDIQVSKYHLAQWRTLARRPEDLPVCIALEADLLKRLILFGLVLIRLDQSSSLSIASMIGR